MIPDDFNEETTVIHLYCSNHPYLFTSRSETPHSALQLSNLPRNFDKHSRFPKRVLSLQHTTPPYAMTGFITQLELDQFSTQVS